jgi:hypothetical protein
MKEEGEMMIPHLKNKLSFWNQLSFPLKLMLFISLVIVLNWGFHYIQLWSTQLGSVLPLQLIFGILIGVIAFSKPSTVLPPVQKNNESVSKNATDKTMTASDESSETLDHQLNLIQKQINILLKDTASDTDSQDKDTTLLPGIPIIISSTNTIYIIKNRLLTLEQENQFDHHITLLQERHPDKRLSVLIGKKIQNDVVYVSIKGAELTSSTIELPLNFMSLN